MTTERLLTSLRIARFLDWGYCYLFVKYNTPLDITKEPPGIHPRIDLINPTCDLLGHIFYVSAMLLYRKYLKKLQNICQT